MGIDPAIIPTSHEGREAEKRGDLERRLRSLETSPQVMVGSGAPTISARDGTLYVDVTALRLYVRAAGAWHYAALT